MSIDAFDFIDDEGSGAPSDLKGIILNVLTIVVLLATFCVVAGFAALYLNPQASFNPFPPSTLPVLMKLNTLTPTPRVVLPPTWTPTATIPPTITDTPEPTETATLVPTLLPEGTDHGTIESTPYGMPFDIGMSSPQFIPNLYHPEAGCNWLGVAGQVFDLSGAPITQLLIEIGGVLNNRLISMITATGIAVNYGDAGYEFVLSDTTRASTKALWLQIIDQAGLPLSEKYYFDTFQECDKNLVLINFKQTR